MANTIEDLVRLNPNDVHTNVFVADINRGGLFVKTARATTNTGTMFMSTNSAWQWNRQYSGALNVKWFGAVGNGVTDDTAEIQAALDAASDSGIYIPPGEYIATSDIEIPSGVSITGDGYASLIDFESATLSEACLKSEGTFTLLPLQGADLSLGDRTTTFASSPGLSVEDIYFCVNTNEYSYSTARSYYFQGDAFQVIGVNGNTVTNSSRAMASFTGTTNHFYKLTPTTGSVKNIRVKGKQGVSLAVLKITGGAFWSIENVDISGSRYAQVLLDRCYYPSVANSVFFDNQSADPDIGLNYGIQVGNTKGFTARNIKGSVTRHLITTGGSSVQPAIPVRFVSISDSHFESVRNSYSLNFHGNTEYISIVNCQIFGGLETGGDYTTVQGGMIFNDSDISYAVALNGECVGANVLLDGVYIGARRNFNEGLISAFSRAQTVRGGLFKVKDCIIDTGTFGHTNYPSSITSGVQIGTVGIPGSTDVEIEVSGTQFRTATTTPGPMYAIYHNVSMTQSVDRVTLKNNRFFRGGIRGVPNAKRVIIENNEITDALDYGINVPGSALDPSQTDQYWFVNNNRVSGSQKTGIRIHTTNTVAAVKGVVSNNRSWNNGQLGAGYESYDLRYFTRLHFFLNGAGDDQIPATQTGAYSILDIQRLSDGLNYDLGEGTNTLPMVVTAVTKANNWPPTSTTTYVDWGYDFLGIGIGKASQFYRLPLDIRRDTNAFVAIQMRNTPGLGNTSAGVGLTLIAEEANGNFGAWPPDQSNVHLQDRVGIDAASDASGLIFGAVTSGQTIDLAAGSGTRNFRFDSGGFLAGSGTIDASAIIQANSTAKGLLPPRMTEAQKNAIGTPAEGLLIRQTDGTVGLHEYRSGAWVLLAGGDSTGLTPPGAVITFAGSSAPTGYLICDGAAVSRATYATLFGVIGETWGVGDGVTTFNLPDMRGRTTIGVGTGAGLTARALADTGGEETHVLTEAELPSSGTPAFHNWANAGMSNVDGNHRVLVDTDAEGGTTYPYSSVTDLPLLDAGSDDPHNVMQPFAAMNYIIKF